MKWLYEGGNNIAYFHKCANSYKKYNCISNLVLEDSKQTDKKETLRAFKQFFKNTFGESFLPSVDIDWDSFNPSFKMDLSSLNAPFSIDEIKATIFSFN